MPIRLLAVLANPLEKRYQGIIAEYTNIGYGTPFDGSFATLPKIKVIINMDKRGCIIAQNTPNTVCLYLTTISFHAR
ncbi:hypothetical protein CPJCM30710_14130 [Clostridium polyendosporum]|uniref:Uncharacterized protein n=1 Tax=Clostridium polyendosporum TaxID=69208 RepID=A0A919RYT3_9CLOT|nr:hypothetical protein CPJCM30710_14130 [Clostridium polyendosporum]